MKLILNVKHFLWMALLGCAYLFVKELVDGDIFDSVIAGIGGTACFFGLRLK